MQSDFSEANVKAAFDECFSIDFVNALYGVVVFFIVIFMVYNIVEAFRKGIEANDRKLFVDLLIKYGKYMAFIVAFPFLLNVVELIGANIQDSLVEKFRPTNYDKTWSQIVYEQKVEADKSIYGEDADVTPGNIFQDFNPLHMIELFWKELSVEINAFFVLLTKKTYFIFVCGRYLWLAMLKIVAPLALVFSLYEGTRQWFSTWLKNMILNYMMIPFFLFAEIFSDAVILAFTKSESLGSLGLFGFIGLFIMKCAMFAVTSKRIMNLM